MLDALIVDDKDNVATALKDLERGDSPDTGEGKSGEIRLLNPVPFGHKFALKDIAAGEAVIKYGEVVGNATAAIAPGEHVHVHNVEGLRGRGDKK